MTSAADRSGKSLPLRETPESIACRKPHRLRVNLKHWAIIHAIIDCGGFANAAEHLNLSQSAISYSVAKMQEQLGVCILRIEGRKAQLTEHGIRLLKYSRQLLRAAAELENYALTLQQQYTELRIAVDEHFPTPILMDGIRLFSHKNRHVNVDLTESSEDEIERLLTDEIVDLAISGYVPADFHGHPLLDIEYLPVAHPNHMLFRLNRDILTTDLENETEIVLAKPDLPALGRVPGGRACGRLWKVRNYDTAVSALCEGLGYAWLPKLRVERALARGRLKLLPLAGSRSHRKTMYLICGRSVTKAEEIDSLIAVLDQVVPESLSHSIALPEDRQVRRA